MMLRPPTLHRSCSLRRGINTCRIWVVSDSHSEPHISRDHLDWLCKLHQRGWAVICVRSLFAGQASLSTCCICPAKQINFRFCVSDCSYSAWAATMPICPWDPEEYFTAEEQVKPRWDLQFLESVIQSTRLRRAFSSLSQQRPRAKTLEENPSLLLIGDWNQD